MSLLLLFGTAELPTVEVWQASYPDLTTRPPWAYRADGLTYLAPPELPREWLDATPALVIRPLRGPWIYQGSTESPDVPLEIVADPPTPSKVESIVQAIIWNYQGFVEPLSNPPAPPAAPELSWQPTYVDFVLPARRVLGPPALFTGVIDPSLLPEPPAGEEREVSPNDAGIISQFVWQYQSYAIPPRTSVPAPDLSWIPIFPDFTRRAPRVADFLAHATPVSPIADPALPDLSWQSEYVDDHNWAARHWQERREFFTIRLCAVPRRWGPTYPVLLPRRERVVEGIVVEPFGTVIPPTLAPDLSWKGHYPDILFHKPRVAALADVGRPARVPDVPLSWQPDFPDWLARERPVEFPHLFWHVDTPPPPEPAPEQWWPTYPSRIYRLETLQAALQVAEVWYVEIIIPAEDGNVRRIIRVLGFPLLPIWRDDVTED